MEGTRERAKERAKEGTREGTREGTKRTNKLASSPPQKTKINKKNNTSFHVWEVFSYQTDEKSIIITNYITIIINSQNKNKNFSPVLSFWSKTQNNNMNDNTNTEFTCQRY